MNKFKAISRYALPILKIIQMDTLFRYLNRGKVLILAYHGVTGRKFTVQPWTLIPVDSFQYQIEYISQKYNVIPLQDAVKALVNGKKLPINPAVITFDDGYKNNFTLAFPILYRYGMPATIFLTAGYIGSREILPLDEVYLVITHARKRNPVTIREIGIGPFFLDSYEDLLESYYETVRILKKFPAKEQKRYISFLKETLESDYEGSDACKEFALLSQEEIEALKKSGLIQFGAHTVSHEICTNIPLKVACGEIIDSKTIIEKIAGQEVNLFAYPNGTEADYNEEHIRCLKDNGFIGSVTTTAGLNKMRGNPYRLGRICVGPELTENLDHFALKVSGFNLL